MRIAGITLLDEKRIDIALTSVYGVGRSLAKTILEEVGVDFSTKVKDIKNDDEEKIRQKIESLTIEGALKRQTSTNIKRLIDIKSYRGFRHVRGLPTRGQNTKTNSRTRKGPRKTMGSGKLKVTKK